MLKNNRPDTEWDEFTLEDYFVVFDQNNKKVGLHFLCPGCLKLIGVREPPWIINFETLTARASILHTKPDGCGWHGFLTDGELTGQIE